MNIAYIDDGDGFDPSTMKLSNPNSHGLKNIKSRILQLDGSINYELTNPGTKVIVSIDL